MRRAERSPGGRPDAQRLTAMDQPVFPGDLVARFPDPFPPPFADAWGDDEHGLWAEFEIPARGESNGVVQRLRWIEPGTFWMGSPEDEPEREDREGPQHSVTIFRGLWLADTACTQSLWQAVMGENPSGFKGAERPVETVSWHDVQEFLRRLEGLLPGCRADLPTEAEWEYACRAGTETSFSFGATITTDEVNYNGNFPYARGVKAEYREATIAAKSLPPNAWGFYEMHGNVWEWCADGMRDYDGEPQVDPCGPEGEETHRACRGGSWFSSARRARSADRNAFHPGGVDYDQGFRLCLRSIEPSQVQGRPSGRPPRWRRAKAAARTVLKWDAFYITDAPGGPDLPVQTPCRRSRRRGLTMLRDSVFRHAASYWPAFEEDNSRIAASNEHTG